MRISSERGVLIRLLVLILFAIGITIVSGFIQINRNCSCADHNILIVGNSGFPLRFATVYSGEQICNCSRVTTLENLNQNIVLRIISFVVDLVFWFFVFFVVNLVLERINKIKFNEND